MTDQTRIDEFLDHACLTYSDAESPQRIQRASQILEAEPTIRGATIHTAAVTGQADATRAMLKMQPALANEVGGPRKWPPLLYLCYSRVPEHNNGGNFLDTARTLLDNGADPNAYFMWGDTYRFTALTGAMGEGEQGTKNQPPHEHAMELAIMLLDAGADPNDSQGLYNTMFTEGNAWIELLLSRGLGPSHKINWKTDNPMSTMDFILGHAVEHGFIERVQMLLDHGANAQSKNHYNKRSHHTNAVLNGHIEIVELLEQHGAHGEGLSPAQTFRAACMRSDLEMARKQLAQDDSLIDDPSLLCDAAANGMITAVEVLIDLGADIDALTTSGHTALHQAAWNGHLDIARTLVAHGAQLLRDTAHDATPAGWAAYAGQPELLHFLLEYSDDIFDLVAHASVDVLTHALEMAPDIVHSCDKHRNTPVHYVNNQREDAVEVLRVLAAHGADLDAKNERGQTAIDLATAVGADNIVSALRQLGAKP